MKYNDRRMFDGWSTAFGIVAALMIIAGLFGIVFWNLGTAIAVIFGGIIMMMMAKTLQWMGEVEHHLRQTAADTARSVDRLNTINGKLDALGKDNHNESAPSVAQQSNGNPVQDFISGK